ncbi:hypothetical protein TNCV_4573521 [Trichonephila clavipes]|nr:hypothetical protein TNCV_4573521 [Trichonephila clavipes]
MLEKVIEDWTSRLDYIRASRGSHMPEIIFKMYTRGITRLPEWMGTMFLCFEVIYSRFKLVPLKTRHEKGHVKYVKALNSHVGLDVEVWRCGSSSGVGLVI